MVDSRPRVVLITGCSVGSLGAALCVVKSFLYRSPSLANEPVGSALQSGGVRVSRMQSLCNGQEHHKDERPQLGDSANPAGRAQRRVCGEGCSNYYR
jgi:hypothetical protein